MALTMQWCWNQTGYFKDASETLTQTEKNKKYAKCQRSIYYTHQNQNEIYVSLSLSRCGLSSNTASLRRPIELN